MNGRGGGGSIDKLLVRELDQSRARLRLRTGRARASVHESRRSAPPTLADPEADSGVLPWESIFYRQRVGIGVEEVPGHHMGGPPPMKLNLT